MAPNPPAGRIQDIVNTTLGEKIKVLRKRCGLSQEQFAEGLTNAGVYVSRKGAWNIEQGVGIRPEHIFAACKVLNTTPDRLFDFQRLNTW